jgi:hypothetical protein
MIGLPDVLRAFPLILRPAGPVTHRGTAPGTDGPVLPFPDGSRLKGPLTLKLNKPVNSVVVISEASSINLYQENDLVIYD